MRLIDVRSYKIREFFGERIPDYAILSHTWGDVDDEVRFQDMPVWKKGDENTIYEVPVSPDARVRSEPDPWDILSSLRRLVTMVDSGLQESVPSEAQVHVDDEEDPPKDIPVPATNGRKTRADSVASSLSSVPSTPDFSLFSDYPRPPPVVVLQLPDEVTSKPGFQKIAFACRQAKRDGLRWVWVDTCCIDKTSSAELSEAINSMYAWYRDSTVCYAYLSDVRGVEGLLHQRYWEASFAASRWFTRGWTLQELIAPAKMSFFGEGWAALGTRSQNSRVIARTTGIHQDLLQYAAARSDPSPAARLNGFSVAQKMSWAARRKCTRVEDTAYCLLGLFEVSLPLLYGEGTHAFLRLQEEIVRTTDDHSILAWTVPEDSLRRWQPSSVFATSPLDFIKSGDVVSLHEEVAAPSVVTKKGLNMTLPVRLGPITSTTPLYRKVTPWAVSDAVLNCRRLGHPGMRIALPVVLDSDSVIHGRGHLDCYIRLQTCHHILVADSERYSEPLPRARGSLQLFQDIFLRTHRHRFKSNPFYQEVGLSRVVLGISQPSYWDKGDALCPYAITNISSSGTIASGITVRHREDRSSTYMRLADFDTAETAVRIRNFDGQWLVVRCWLQFGAKRERGCVKLEMSSADAEPSFINELVFTDLRIVEGTLASLSVRFGFGVVSAELDCHHEWVSSDDLLIHVGLSFTSQPAHLVDASSRELSSWGINQTSFFWEMWKKFPPY